MDVSYPSLGRARYAQLTLAFVALFGAMDTQVIGLLVEPIKHDLGLTDLQIGLAYGAAYFAAYGLFAIPGGLLADRFSRTRLVLLAMVLNCAALGLAGMSHSLSMLVLSKVLAGVHSALVYPAAMSLLADFFPPARRAFGTMSYPIGQTLGNVVALLIGGLGYTALVNAMSAGAAGQGGLAPWRMVSLIFAAIGVLILPMLLAMREPSRMEVGDAAKGSFRELWDYRRLLVPMFVGIMGLGGAFAGVATWVAPALMRLYKLQPGDFAAYSSAITLGCSLVSLVATGKLVNLSRARGGNRMLMLPAAILTLLCIPCALMGAMPTAAGFAVLYALYLVFNGVALAVPVLAINFEIPNELRGLCTGCYVVLLSAASMAGAPLVGYAGRLLGGDHMIGLGIAVVAAPFLLIAALSFWRASGSLASGIPSTAIPGAAA